MGLPCFSSGRLDPTSAGSNHAPVDVNMAGAASNRRPKPTLATLRLVVEEATRSLVMADKIGRGEARENAVAAGKCVEVGLQ